MQEECIGSELPGQWRTRLQYLHPKLKIQHSEQFLGANGGMGISVPFYSALVNEKSEISALDRKPV